jgi:hypothetical protein
LLLKRVALSIKKPVLTPCKANVEKQEVFVKPNNKIKEKLESQDHFYFMDVAHAQHKSMAHYGC